MTLEYWHGDRLLWAENDEDRAAILATIGPPTDTLRQITHAEAALVYAELLRLIRARPPHMTKTQPVQPRARGTGRIFRNDGTEIEADTGPEVDQK